MSGSPSQKLRPFGGSYLCLLALLEESLLASLLLGLLCREIFRCRDFVDLCLRDTSKINLERRGNNVSCVDAAEGNTIDLEGAGDEEDTLLKGLEENHTLAAEATGEKDQDGARLERFARSPSALGLADLEPEAR